MSRAPADGTRAARLRPYLPAVAWAATLLVLGTRPNLPGPATVLPVDKIAHYVAYGVLGTLTGWGWLRAGRRPAAALVVAAGVLLGVTDEVLQSFVPGRTAEIGDVIADAAGVATGFFLAVRHLSRRNRSGY